MAFQSTDCGRLCSIKVKGLELGFRTLDNESSEVGVKRIRV